MVAQSNSLEFVEQIYDQYLDFVVLEPTFFSLLPPPSPSSSSSTSSQPQQQAKRIQDTSSPSQSSTRTIYEMLNDPKATESDVEEVVDRVALGLMNVIATLGQVPIIRCPRGNAAEMVAHKLDARLRDQVHSRTPNAFNDTSSTSSFSRPGARAIAVFI
jgi:hypothetical protein